MPDAPSRAEALLRAMPHGLLCLSLDSRITFATPRACDLLGLPHPLPEGLSLADLSRATPELADWARGILAMPESLAGEPVVAPDARGRRLLVSASLWRDESGLPREVLIALQNIQEVWPVEPPPERNATQTTLPTLAIGLAHDIRNPLTAIKTYASVLRSRINQPGFLERFERSVPAGILRIEGLLDDLSSLGRPPRLEPEEVRLPDLLARCLGSMEEELAIRSIRWELSVKEGCPSVWGDEALLAKAFLGLLRFSCRGASDGGRLTLRVAPDKPGAVSARISGNAAGLGPEHMPKLFEPYFTPTGQGGGAGLDLALTRMIIREHGGSIEARSLPDQVLTFNALLPTARQREMI